MEITDSAFLAEPFADGVPTYGDNDLSTLDYAYLGQPFNIGSTEGGATTTIISGNIKRILKVDWPYVKTIINVEG